MYKLILACCDSAASSSSFESAAIGIIGAILGAAVGGYATYAVAKWQMKSVNARDLKLGTSRRWNRIYANLRIMSINLKDVALYSEYTERTVKVNPNSVPSEWAARSSEAFKRAREAEANLIDDLTGAEGISREDKKLVFSIIYPYLTSNNTPQELRSRAIAIENILESVRLRADNDIAHIQNELDHRSNA